MEIKEVSEDKIRSYLDSTWEKYNEKYTLEIEFEKDKYFYAALSDKEIIGAAVIEHMGGICHIKDLIVSEDQRRTGVGKELFKQIEKFAEEHNCRKITVKTHEKNKASLKFYKKQGMTQDAELENYQFRINWYYFSKKM